MNRFRILAVAAAGAAVLMASPASAASAGSGAVPLRAATVTGDMVQKVNWRRYRHCHRRYGRRRCHGRRHARYYRYGLLPGVGIYIGRRHHHYRHHRWHRRRWR